MKFALSTNWCNRRIESGEEIADLAYALGFDELELGFHTTIAQVQGFRARLDRMPIGSVHAFCPVPLSAPHGYPELYTLASFDAEARAMARLQISRNIDFAADIGARTVVLHAGRVPFTSFFRINFTSSILRILLEKAKGDLTDRQYVRRLAQACKLRRSRGLKMVEIVKQELAALVPLLEQRKVVLALENLPYLEGFPDEAEMAMFSAEFKDAPIKAWFDTGHRRVRESYGWVSPADVAEPAHLSAAAGQIIRGIHLNDVVDFSDDHFAPGDGNVDFAALAPLARAVEHRVFEPNDAVTEAQLTKGLALIRSLWTNQA